MALGRSSNPVLSQKFLDSITNLENNDVMTVKGAINKTAILFLLVVLSATVTWKLAAVQNVMAGTLSMVGLFGGLGFALVTIFKKDWAHITAPIYALFEGLFLGAISAFINTMYPGIAIQAVGITFGVLLTMLVIYKTGIIKVTGKFTKGLMAATGGILIFYLINMVLGFFGAGISLANMGWLGIGIQAAIVIIAALNLVLDFDYIERTAAANVPKKIEWYAAFGLMVTLIWLYLEILRLLTLLARR